MRQHGAIKSWNAERGFGFIEPADGGATVFVHIKDFPRGGGLPEIGEMVSFEVTPGDKGKPRAVRIMRAPGRAPTRASAAPRRPSAPRQRSSRVLSVAVVFAVAAGAAGLWTRDRSVPMAVPAPTAALISESPEPLIANRSSFQCDGRTHCSEMHSCEEATYFLQHCPDVEMDGDGDGVACEQQWCN